ncbi:uncharacterized protein LOC129307015 [Prosopis cineraria]|uniref:uncharacterized protein LOC129307015 n=1 Tax=Prosopis cineraria TaxID=364024 RepID=UPI00240F517C|nr:uncharacterized protein LOC129307015 [Prosopis cineraria]
METFQSPMMVNRTISCAFPSRQSKQIFGVSNSRLLFIFLNRSPPRPVSFKIEANNSNFTFSYLVGSCGLAPEAATSVSQKVQLHSSERPDSVLTLLREHGLSKSQISNVVRKRPSLLLANPNPTILTRSLEKQIIPSYNFLKSVLLSDEKVASALKRTSWIFLEDHSKKLLPNISVLRATGVPESCIALLLAHFPETLIQKNGQFVNAVEEIKEMGFDPTKSTFVLAIHVMAGNKSIYNRCVEVYQRWGWSEEEILMSFRKHPNCMLLSEDKITKAMDFLVNKMGWPSRMIASCPVVLFFSLEKRIKPRCSVVQALRLKGLIKKTLSLSTVLLPDKKRFVEKFVTKYEHQVSDLWSIYEMKVDFKSVI